MGIFVFLTERDWSRKNCYGNSIKGVILFLLWCTFVVPSFKNPASIFPEILFIQYFTIFSCQQDDIITDDPNRKTTISLKRKKIFQKEKCYSSVFWQAFPVSRNYFSCHIHFNDKQKLCKNRTRTDNRSEIYFVKTCQNLLFYGFKQKTMIFWMAVH